MKKHLLSFILLVLLIFSQARLNTQNQPNSTKDIQDLLIKTADFINDAKIREASDSLIELSKLVNNESQRKYFKILAEEILDKRAKKGFLFWNKMKEKVNPDLLIYKKNKKLIPLVFTYQPQLKEKIQRYINNIDQFLEKIKFLDHYTIIPRQIAPIYIVDLLNTIDTNSFIIVPSIKDRSKSGSYLILFLYNHFTEFLNYQILSLAKDLLGDEESKKITPSSALFFHILNRLSYYFGYPILETNKDPNKIDTLDKNLTNKFQIIQEIRANTATVFCSSVFFENKFITMEEEESIYLYYLMFLIYRLKSAPDSLINQPYLLQFNKLIKTNGISFNLKNQKIELNIKDARKILLNLQNEILSIEKEGKLKRFDSMLRNFSTIPDELQRIQKILNEK